MTSYPKVNDIQFNKKIIPFFNKFKDEKKTYNEYCFPKKYKYQNQQLFVSSFLSPKTPYSKLILFHKIGAGKTCGAILIAEQWKQKKKIIYCCPASIIPNTYDELLGLCANYLTEQERNKLDTLNHVHDDYKEIINNAKKRIDKYYNIISYNKFITLIREKIITPKILEKSLLIIDEVQNVVSENGQFYKTIKELIDKVANNKLHIVLLSATPIFDKPVEIALAYNLLNTGTPIPTGNEFNKLFIDDNKVINKDKLKKYLSGYISYSKGAPLMTYPKRIEKIVRCIMSPYQLECYNKIMNKHNQLKNNTIMSLSEKFLLGLRMISNIAYPKKLTNEDGFELFDAHIMDDLNNYSPKLYKMMNKIKKSKGLIFIYSGFRMYNGLELIIKVLEFNGYKNLMTYGPGFQRFALYSGSETLEQKDKIKKTFNDKNNMDGSLLKIILGSPAIKEGISLLRVKQIHVIEPYWNLSRYEQVIGRALRFCSHKDMPLNERYVNIYLYLSVFPKEIKNDKSVDEHIYEMALKKQKINNSFYKVIKQSSIDYNLY